MAYGAGGGDRPVAAPVEMLASEAERERCQAVLKQAFEDERLTQDEFESRVGFRHLRLDPGSARGAHPRPAGSAAAAPVAPSRRSRLPWLIGGIVVAVVVLALISARFGAQLRVTPAEQRRASQGAPQAQQPRDHAERPGQVPGGHVGDGAGHRQRPRHQPRLRGPGVLAADRGPGGTGCRRPSARPTPAEIPGRPW